MFNNTKVCVSYFLKYGLLWCLVNFAVLTTQAEDDQRGVEFPEDILIGRSQLTDNGTESTKDHDDYYITLLPVEGNSSNYVYQKSGYIVGFQWYNGMHSETHKTIKWQIYVSKHEDTIGGHNIGGDYTLLNQTEWINAKKGFNYYLFTEPIKVDMEYGNKEFIIGFMMNKKVPSPILKDYCKGDKPSWYATMKNTPNEGQAVTFEPETDSKEHCVSYNFQGIFLPTDKATPAGGNCHMYVANQDHGTLISRYGYQLWDDEDQLKRSCILTRAEKPWLKLEITTIDLYFPYNIGCESYVEISDEQTIYGDQYRNWGLYCRKSDIFRSKYIDNPYIFIYLDINSHYRERNIGFKFKVVAENDQFVKALVAVIIGCVISGLILFAIISCIACCCCGCCLCCRKKRRNTTVVNETTPIYPSQPQGTRHYTVQQSNGVIPPASVGAPTVFVGNNPSVYGNPNTGYYPPSYEVSQQVPHTRVPYTAPPAYSAPGYEERPTDKEDHGNETDQLLR